MKLGRRRFVGFAIGAAAGSAAGTSMGHVMSDILAAANSDIYPSRGPESFALSVCQMCQGGCGLRVRRIAERVVKADGNPLHPVNGGRLCPRGQASIQSLHHPDRIPSPMRRVGQRGAIGSFEPATWKDALDAIGSRLRLLRDGRRPESLVLLRGRGRDVGARMLRRLVRAVGSPNDVSMERGDEAAAIALWLTQGVRTTPAHDLQSAEYVLSLGNALCEASTSPVHTARSFGRFRQVQTGRRGKLVQVEARLSATAAVADEWVEVRPGTEGIFGLGVAAVIVAEGLYDKSFVIERTDGFEDRAGNPGLKSLLEKSFTLERAAALTNVPVNTILRIARELAGSRRGLAVGPRRGPLLPGATFDHLAACALNALVGNIDAAGGTLVPEESPLPPWPELPADPIAQAGTAKPRMDGAAGSSLLLSDPEQLAESLLSATPYPADVLMILGADPLLTSAHPDRFAQALDRVPTVISFASMPDDTAVHADWILPEPHFLERWDLYDGSPGLPYPMVSLAKPALRKPLQDVKHVGDVVLELAARLGIEAAFPWKDLAAVLRADMDGLYGSARGAIMGSDFDEAWVRMMERAGWWAPGYHSADELWQKAQASGGWWDPFYDHGDWRRVLRTESGRFDFRPDLLAKAAAHSPAGEVQAGEGAEESRGTEGLSLVLFEPLAIAGGTGAELPFLQGILDPGLEERWDTWAEIHPETARKIGVGDRDWVRITSGAGAIVARARVTPRIVEGAVAVPVGQGKRAGGRWSSGVGSNPLRLLSSARDPLSGLPDFDATTVRIAVVAGNGKPPSARHEGSV